MAWAMGNTNVNTPSNPNSTFTQHDDFNFWAAFTNAAHDANYQTYLNGGKFLPPGACRSSQIMVC